MDDILLVHTDDVFRTLLAGVLAKALNGCAAQVQGDALDAQALAVALQPQCRLAVLGAAVPAERGAAPDYALHAAVKQFLATIGAQRPGLPVLVLATEHDAELGRLVGAHAQGRLASVAPGSGWQRAAAECAREAFGLAPAQAGDLRRTRTILRIMLSSHQEGSWTMERRGRVEETPDGALVFDPVEFGGLCTKAQKLGDTAVGARWDDWLSPVANDMYKAIFLHDKNLALRRAFESALSEPDGAGKMRLVFDLSADSYIVPVETLKRYALETNVEQWFGLQSAILRQYRGAGPLEPLFWDHESRNVPVDCLLIAADTRGSTKEDEREGLSFAALPQVEYEVDALAALLEARKAAGVNIGAVKVLKLGEHDRDEMATVLGRTMASKPWRLVHFAGHAHIASAPGSGDAGGHLVLYPARGGLFDFAAFARGLPHAQFVCLSSCRSANPVFLQQLIRQSVPAVLGYRWPVDDVQARELASSFYDALLTQGGSAYRSLGRALAQARRRLFTDHLSDATWASAVLLTKGSRQDESSAPPAAAGSDGVAP